MAKTILIVEDDNSFRLALRWSLTDQGFEILEASSGNRALKMLKLNPVDLVILDIFLGDMNGIQFLDKAAIESKIPVIVLTAYGEEDIFKDALVRGAVHCLTKPVKKEDLIAAINKALPNGKDDE